MTALALAISADAPDHDDDLPLLADAARARGHDLVLAVWDDPGVDWATFERVVIRSCWDYVPRRDEFLAWAASVPRLHNDAATVRWNTDKSYLRQLADAGVPIIETQWDVRTGDLLADADEWVVKPTISAGSADTARWSDPTDVYAHSERLLAAGRPTMTQPYIASVDDEGETALLFFGGTFSHAARKGPMLERGRGGHVEAQLREDMRAREPRADQLEVAHAVLEATTAILTAPPLYARVDLVTGADGSPRLMELELTEPSLFLPFSPGSADRFLDAVANLA